MNVEGVTHELQIQSKAAKARLQGPIASEANTSSLSLNTDQPSVTSSIELAMPTKTIRRDTDTSQYAHLAESAQSWVDQFTSESGSSFAPSEIEHSQHGAHIPGSPTSSSGAHLSDSITSASVSLISGSDDDPLAVGYYYKSLFRALIFFN